VLVCSRRVGKGARLRAVPRAAIRAEAIRVGTALRCSRGEAEVAARAVAHRTHSGD